MPLMLQFNEADLLLTIAKWFFTSLNSGFSQMNVNKSNVDIINIIYLNGIAGGGEYCSIGQLILSSDQPVPSPPLPP